MKYILTLALTVAFATSTFAGGKCGDCPSDDGAEKSKDKAGESTQS